jgi:hypothetical protein
VRVWVSNVSPDATRPCCASVLGTPCDGVNLSSILPPTLRVAASLKVLGCGKLQIREGAVFAMAQTLSPSLRKYPPQLARLLTGRLPQRVDLFLNARSTV